MTARKGSGRGGGNNGRGGEEDYTVDDDFLDDLEAEIDDDYDDEGADYDGDADDEDADGEDDLERVISAETQEWPAPEPPTGEEEQPTTGVEAIVASIRESADKARSAITSPFEAIREGLPSHRHEGEPGYVPDEHGRRRRRWRPRLPLWAKFTLASFLIVGSTAGATTASMLLYVGDIADALSDNLVQRGVEDILETIEPGAPQTIMIIGSDIRPDERKMGIRFGRSDTTILLRLNPNKNAFSLLSIPRDLKVDIPGHGIAKFNDAYTLGGPKLTLRTVKELTGLEVNHLVNVNFAGFAKAVNAIGCVYVDVDRRYYHSNEGLAAADQYAEIDVRPGYQRLCGFKALDYARYRHTDNDIVRAARQQDFLREARHKVPPTKLFTDRKKLINIFTEYTTSDIDDPREMIDVLHLFIAARNAPVKEVHFQTTLGKSFVYASPGQIEQAVSDFLGTKKTPGARGRTAAPEEPVRPESPKNGKAKKAKAKKVPKKGRGPADVVSTGFGKSFAWYVRRQNRKIAIWYPGIVQTGSEFVQRPRVYTLKDPALRRSERFSYKFVLRTRHGEYYGLQGTKYEEAPILEAPHEERTFDNDDRTYDLYYDGDRLRLVAWEDGDAVYWISNTLLQSLTEREMLEIARGARNIPPKKGA